MHRLFDAPALFGRDIKEFEKLIGAWTCSEPDRYDKVSFLGPQPSMLLGCIAPGLNRLSAGLYAVTKFGADATYRRLYC